MSYTYLFQIDYFLVLVYGHPRHSFTTRLLLTCIRSKLYYKEKTTDDIFEEIARQAQDMCEVGVRDS